MKRLSVIERVGDYIHRSGDKEAKRYGWTITKTTCGLGRIYQDRKWEVFPKKEVTHDRT